MILLRADLHKLFKMDPFACRPSSAFKYIVKSLLLTLISISLRLKQGE